MAPNGYAFSPQDQGADDSVDSDTDADGQTVCTTLEPGETDTTWDAGLYQPASIGDTVWDAVSVDVIQDAGEPGLEGVTVNLYDCDGNLVDSTITNADGLYSFGVAPGDYYLEFVAPNGYVYSPQDQGTDDTADSDADADGQTVCTTLESGETDPTWDAGLYRPASIGDRVWDDVDRDGIQDADEPGLPGVNVELYHCDGTHVATTSTDASGLYGFSVEPGQYYVRFAPPDDYVFSPQDQGADDAADSDADPNTGETACTTLVSGETDPTWDAGLYYWLGACLVIIDEGTIDNDILSIEQTAYSHSVTPDWLVNDDRPTEYGNPWLRWNEHFPGDVVLLPSGQVDDEGWFALPEVIRYVDNVVTFPFTDMDGNLIESSDDWVNAFAQGTLPQDKLDKVRDVMPLRNHELVQLVGRTCVAVVYDSDISMNYVPIYTNLQGERYGRFAFTVLAVEVPGSIPESKSSTSLYDLWLRVEPPIGFDERFDVPVRDHEPDSIQTTKAEYQNGSLVVWGVSNFAPGAYMTVSVDGADAGTDRFVDPFILEAPMTYNAGMGRYEYVFQTPVNLDDRRVTISTDEGGAYNDYVR